MARSTRPSAAGAIERCWPLRSKSFLAPVASERVRVEVPDVRVAGGAVHPFGVGLLGTGVEPGDRVAQRARLVLERDEQRPGDPAAARLRDDVHPLDLAGSVGEPLDAAAADRLAVLVTDD